MSVRGNHFLALVGEICSGAELGGLEVEVRTSNGRTLSGVPHAHQAGERGAQVDATGYSAALDVGDETVDLSVVREIRVRAPQESPAEGRAPDADRG